MKVDWIKVYDVLKRLGYTVVIDKQEDDVQCGFLTVLKDRDVYEFYISAKTFFANIQMLSSISIHDARDITSYFQKCFVEA